MSTLQGVTVDPAALIVALSGLMVAASGLRQRRTGQKNERQQQAAANELQMKAQNHDAQREIIVDLERQVDRRDVEIAALQDERTQLRREYRSDLAHLREVVTTLRDVVHSEIATSLADDGIDVADRGMDRIDPDEKKEA